MKPRLLLAFSCVAALACTAPPNPLAPDAGYRGVPPEPLQVIELADVSVGSATGALRFVVPEPKRGKRVGFSIVAEPSDPGVCVFLKGLAGPGTTYVRGGGCGDGAETGRGTTAYGEGGLVSVVPGNDAPESEVTPGEHCVSVSSIPCNTSSPDARLKVRAVISERQGGALALHVHLVQRLGITPEQAPSHAGLQETIARFFKFMEVAGFRRGEVAYSALDDQHAVVTSDEQFDALMVLGTGRANGKPALDVMVVDGFAGPLEGVAGMAPLAGSQGMGGGTQSAAVVSWSNQPSLDGLVWAHEVGHFLGLYHTNEFGGSAHDDLRDTRECTPFADCGPDDEANVMFPSATYRESRFSDAQRDIIALTPLIDPTVAPPPQACSTDEDCPPETSGCKRPSCVEGACWGVWLPNGTACDDKDGMDCTRGACESGECEAQGADDHVCLVDNTCVGGGQTAEGQGCWVCDPIADPEGWTKVSGCVDAGPRPGGPAVSPLSMVARRLLGPDGGVPGDAGYRRGVPLSMYVVMRNSGDEPAVNPTITLSTAEPEVDLLRDVVPFGQIQPRTSRESLQPLRFTVREDFPCDQHYARLTLRMSADGVESARRRINLPLDDVCTPPAPPPEVNPFWPPPKPPGCQCLAATGEAPWALLVGMVLLLRRRIRVRGG
ncbi:MAG: hypothetical protein AB2A00_20455 [Myxococcota bacterium]